MVQKYVCNAKIKDIEDRLPNISNLATTVVHNAKIKDVKNELPSMLLLIWKYMRLKTKYISIMLVI